ncbi:amidase [Homoserinibacter sp. GY 40078]|uniref:amidase n=1 Tax=Homoserinibacter sp. GY 40078 TaxID=2603275 RepID=UPI00165085C0|nr:amidase [Homoserinibacter sp. GY 40078]
MTEPGILELSLAEIAAAVRAGEADGRELASVARERIARSRTGAVVGRLVEPVVSSSGPLAGIPTLLKDLQADAADLPLVRGSRAFAEATPRGDSTLVARLRSAGASILGRTNTPEFGLNLTTEPLQWGPTRNPVDPQRSAGGSSGGAAAAVAEGLVPFAHATDSGGSIRIPSAWCGVVGFKPSRGAIPAGPYRLDDWQGMSHEFAITRTVADAAYLFRVVRGPAPGEWQPPVAELPGSMRSRVGVVVSSPVGEVDPVWAGAAAAAATTLRDRGHEIVELGPVGCATRIGPVFGRVVAAHLARLLPDPSRDRLLEPAVAEVVQLGRSMSAAQFIETVDELHDLGRELADGFADVDLVLSPTTAVGAPAIGEVRTDRPSVELFRDIFRISPFAAMFNVTGGPAISVPWGRGPDGMPVGVQLGAAPGQDARVLSVALEIEDAAAAAGHSRASRP